MPIAVNIHEEQRYCENCGRETMHQKRSYSGLRMNMRPGSLSYPYIFPWLVVPGIIFFGICREWLKAGIAIVVFVVLYVIAFYAVRWLFRTRGLEHLHESGKFICTECAN